MRFKPIRAGIFNVWEYDEQTFEFGDGRLAIRGRNGSGKSNALSLLFPFVLDGVMSAARMDPMGGGRSMKSLLLGRDDDHLGGGFRHDAGTGYVWMEFGNETEYITIGVGASATQQRDADPWFFVTHQRVGLDLDLAENDVPLGRRQLQDRLRDGAVYATAEEYRSAVDRHLLGLGNLRYRRLVDLLLTLRRPHLAGKLDVEHLSSTLSAGLGELDPSLIEDVAHSFDDLDAMQHQLGELETAMTAIERFLPSYRDHLVGIGRARAESLLAAEGESRRLRRALGEATRGREAAQLAVTDLRSRSVELDADRERIDGRIENIQQSPAYRSAVALDEVRRSADKADRIAVEAAKRRDEANTVASNAAVAVESAQVELDAAMLQVSSRVVEWCANARSAGLDVSMTAADFDDARATSMVSERSRQHEEVMVLVESTATAAAEARRAERVADAAHDAVNKARADLDRAELVTSTALDALRVERVEWGGDLCTSAESLRRLASDLTAATTFQPNDLWVVEAAVASTPEGDVSAAAYDAIAATATAERIAADLSTIVARALDTAESATSAQHRILDDLRTERDSVAQEPNPGPPSNPTRPDAQTDGRPGAPLYVCVDFADTVDANTRAGIEAALWASGLLDARVMPDGAHDESLDADLRRGGVTTGGPTLADLLVPVKVPGLDIAQIHDTLRSISLDGDLLRLRSDGTWRLGPVGGKFIQPAPLFIGHAAREARRIERLAVLDAEITEANTHLMSLGERSQSLRQLAADIDSLRQHQPSTRDLDDALSALRAAGVRSDERARHLAEAQTHMTECVRQAEAVSAEMHSTASRFHLPANLKGLQEVRNGLARCEVLRLQVSTDQTSATRAQGRREVAHHNHLGATERARAAANEANTAQREAELERRRFDDLSADVGGDANKAIDALAKARDDRAGIDQEMRDLATGLAEAKSELARLAERIDRLADQQSGAEAQLVETEERFRVICSSEVAEVLALDGVEPQADRKGAARALMAGSEPPMSEATNRMEKAYREVLLDGLRAGHDPSMPKIDGVDVVRVGSADGDLPIGRLARQLRDEHGRTAQLLTQNEREIFETHLLTRVGDSLRTLLLDADSFEHRINSEMSQVPTESGMVVELRWEVAGDDPGIAAAVKSLRTAPEMLSPERREALREFFMRRIADLRSAEPGRSFAETLTSALDYRAWHNFVLYARFTTGKRQRVTRTFYRGLSGGEAATLLHLPLFAAAAAQYGNGSIAGPRMIALDEAFVGIDDKMRSRLMGLLTQLDLDVIVTSHEFWGFYDTVPALVLYDLIRRPPTPGVFAQRFDWISDTGSRSHDARN